jgi:hypothetical protein
LNCAQSTDDELSLRRESKGVRVPAGSSKRFDGAKSSSVTDLIVAELSIASRNVRTWTA